MAKRNRKRRPANADAILTKGGMTAAQIKAGREREQLRQVAMLTNALTAIVTAGGEILISDFMFTQAQAADWATKTIAAARAFLPQVDEPAKDA